MSRGSEAQFQLHGGGGGQHTSDNLAETSISLDDNVETALCPGHLQNGICTGTALQSYGPLVLQVIGPTGHWSYCL